MRNRETVKESNYYSSEVYRHQCEVRYLLRMRKLHGKEWLQKSLRLIEKHRSAIVVLKLKKDLLYQWQNKNFGDIDDLWFD